MKNTPASHPADLFSQSAGVFNRDLVTKGNESVRRLRKTIISDTGAKPEHTGMKSA